MKMWLLIISMGLITYAIRLSAIVGLKDKSIPTAVRKALDFVPPAVLSAIIFPELLISGGELNLTLGNARLIAGIVAAFTAWRTENVLWTVGAGMAVLWILQAL